MTRVALVTGGSSGIGQATVHALSRNGYIVYEMSRHDSNRDSEAHHLTADVTIPSSVQAAVRYVLDTEKRLDLVVNNAGFGISGAVEFADFDEIKRQFDVNFFGLDTVCRSVLPALRNSRGRIINISSMAAVVPIPFQTMYSASKAAINAYTLALANEVRPFGVTVCAVMPGDIHTNFTTARHKQLTGDDVYGGRIARSVARMENDEQHGMKSEDVGKYVTHLAQRRSVKPLYAVRIDYKLISLLARLLPVRLLNWLLGLLYAS